MSRSVASARRRDTAFASCLALVLAIGVVGVLLLNTSMQQQAQAMARAHDRLATLTGKAEQLRADLDWTADPAALAARAHGLRLRPVQRVEYVRLSDGRRQVSGQRQAAARAHAG